MKLLGILCIGAVPLLFCFRQGEELRKKQKARDAFLLFLEYTLFQIENFDRDQREIFFGFENADLEKSLFLPSLRREVEKNPCGAMERVLPSHFTVFSFSPEAEEILRVFSAHFGMQAKMTQIIELKRAIQILRESGEKERKETEKKIKITRMIGVTACLGILILMI